MTLSIQASYISDKGLNPRYKVNEDSYLIMKDEHAYAVADGVGGAHAGDLASRSALKFINASIREYSKKFKGSPIDFLRKVIEAGNKIVFEMGQKKNRQMASTVAIMLLQDNYALLGHVGDSRIYVVRNGHISQLTRDHSKLEELKDKNPDMALNSNNFADRHVITKALGVSRFISPDIQKVFLKNDDVFIICTDGIYRHHTENDLLTTVKNNINNPNEICRTLKETCYRKGAKDNLTAVVLKIGV